MKQTLLSAALLAACGFALAKLPAPVLDDAAKAKAAEAAAKAAWQAKVDGYQLCKAQDRVAARMGKAPGGKDAKGAAVPGKAVVPVKSAAAASAPAATPAAAAASGTPVALATPALPPCLEPGPFAFNAPEQKPLETSGAHSPTGTAATPPSVSKPSAEMAPGGKKP